MDRVGTAREDQMRIRARMTMTQARGAEIYGLFVMGEYVSTPTEVLMIKFSKS